MCSLLKGQIMQLIIKLIFQLEIETVRLLGSSLTIIYNPLPAVAQLFEVLSGVV